MATAERLDPQQGALRFVARFKGNQPFQNFRAAKRGREAQKDLAEPGELEPAEIGFSRGPGAGWGERFSDDGAPRKKIAQ